MRVPSVCQSIRLLENVNRTAVSDHSQILVIASATLFASICLVLHIAVAVFYEGLTNKTSDPRSPRSGAVTVLHMASPPQSHIGATDSGNSATASDLTLTISGKPTDNLECTWSARGPVLENEKQQIYAKCETQRASAQTQHRRQSQYRCYQEPRTMSWSRGRMS